MKNLANTIGKATLNIPMQPAEMRACTGKFLRQTFNISLAQKRVKLSKLLGPERCSSKLLQTVDYKIGQQRLRFYFKNDRVLFLQLATVMYDLAQRLQA
jgi:hypothetical protein